MSARFDLRANLAAIKLAAITRVDAEGEQERLLWITPGAGQAAVYLLKRDEAQRFRQLSPGDQASADPEDWPLLAAELDVTGDTLAEVADEIWALASVWVNAAAAIEAVRLAAKRDVEAAATPAAVHAILEAIVWPPGP